MTALGPSRALKAVLAALQTRACYDALDTERAAQPSGVPTIPTDASMAASTADSKRTPPTRPAGPITASAAATASVSSFGLDRHDESERVESSLPGACEGWGLQTHFERANGQEGAVADDSPAVYKLHSPPIRARHVAISDFVMDCEGARRAPRVRRLNRLLAAPAAMRQPTHACLRDDR